MKKKTFIILILPVLALVAGYFLKETFATSNPHSWDDGLVGYWSFDGQYTTSTDGTADVSGNNNWGTFSGGVKPVAGIVGQALFFDGIDDYVEANAVAEGNLFDAAHTIVAWVKLASWGANMTAVGGGVTALPIYYTMIGFKSDNKFWVQVNGPGGVNEVVTAATYDNDTNWHFLAVTVDADGHINHFIVDGVDEGNDSTKDNSDLSSIDHFYIGQIPYSVPNISPFDGTIDEVRVYNRALSVDEIMQHYKQTRRNLQIRAWLGNWENRVKLTVDHNDVDSHLSNFPFLIYLSTSTGRGADDLSFVFDEVGSNSKKIAVTKSDGTTQLYVEIEKWDNSNEQAWLWTNASGTDSISSTTDTNFYLYYDNSHADNTTYVGDTNSTPAENVWDANFVLVDHLRDDPDTSHTRDSTDKSNDGTKTSAGNPAEAAGKIGDGQDVSGDRINHGHDASLNLSEFTQSMWINIDTETGASEYRDIWGKSQSPYPFMITQTPAGTSLRQYINFSGGLDALVIGAAGTGVWRRVSWRFNNTTKVWSGHFSDQAVGTKNMPGETMVQAAAYDVLLGYYYTARKYDGKADEARLSNISRSDAWEKASYESERDDLLDFGDKNELTRLRIATANPHDWSDGLVGYWNFNGQNTTSSGTRDMSNEDNWGSIVGAIPRAGIVGQALSFDGVNDYVSVGGYSNAKTLEVWFYLTQSASSKGNLNYLFSHFFQHSANNFFYFNAPWGGSAYFNAVVPTVNVWHHLVLIRPTPGYKEDVDGSIMYLDTVPTNISLSGGPNVEATGFSGLSSPTANCAWSGLIDEVRVYNRELSAEEIKIHYEQTRRNLRL